MTTMVVAAAIIERDGRLLITKRQQGVHLEGYWEFPGGKCEEGETLAACVSRELREELAVDVRVGGEVFTTYTYRIDRGALSPCSCSATTAAAGGHMGPEGRLQSLRSAGVQLINNWLELTPGPPPVTSDRRQRETARTRQTDR